jgi:hypothetical protein
MKRYELKQLVGRWVQENRAGWPGLRAAHLVGSLAGLPDEAEFPA